jgi:kinase-associated protein B
MTSSELSVGTKVTAAYKTGEYIGEIVELTSSIKAAVRILAVRKHPTQGDLHNPMQANVAFFHQRRALSHNEIALMPLNTVKPYHGAVPDYSESLRAALDNQIRELTGLEQWAKRSLQELEQLNKEYKL